MTYPPGTPWPVLIPELRQLWADGLSTREIGLKIGKTKDAVVGKAHRLKLPPRLAPVVRLVSGLYERRYSGGAKAAAEGETLPAPVPKRPKMPKPKPVVVTAPEPQPQPLPAVVVAAVVAAVRASPARAAHDGKRGPRSSFPPPRPADVARPDWTEQPEPRCCRWPMWGKNERAGWPQRFCTAARMPGGSYCAGHRAVAYRGAWAPAETVEDAA